MLAATRVSARTFEYESLPSANAAEIAGNSRSAFAVRTFSRAAPGDIPQRHASQSAQLAQPHFAQPKRSSNSRTSTSMRYVSAFICCASCVMARSRSSTERSSEAAKATAPRVVCAVMDVSERVGSRALIIRPVLRAFPITFGYLRSYCRLSWLGV